MNQQIIRSGATIQIIALVCILSMAGTSFAQDDTPVDAAHSISADVSTVNKYIGALAGVVQW